MFLSNFILYLFNTMMHFVSGLSQFNIFSLTRCSHNHSRALINLMICKSLHKANVYGKSGMLFVN